VTDKLTPAELSAALETCKSRKLRICIQQLIVSIDGLDRQTVMNTHLDQFYYIEKEAEMLLLEQRLEEALERVLWLLGRMEINFEEVFTRWRTDMKNLPDINTHSFSNDLHRGD